MNEVEFAEVVARIEYAAEQHKARMRRTDPNREKTLDPRIGLDMDWSNADVWQWNRSIGTKAARRYFHVDQHLALARALDEEIRGVCSDCMNPDLLRMKIEILVSRASLAQRRINAEEKAARYTAAV